MKSKRAQEQLLPVEFSGHLLSQDVQDGIKCAGKINYACIYFTEHDVFVFVYFQSKCRGQIKFMPFNYIQLKIVLLLY